jgi:hypothetical protein
MQLHSYVYPYPSFSYSYIPKRPLLLHFVKRGYPTMTWLHYMTTLPCPTWHLLCHGMREGSHPLYIGLHGSCGLAMCPPSTLFYNSRVFSILILSYKYLLEYFTLYHETCQLWFLSPLHSSRTFLHCHDIILMHGNHY